MKGTQRFVVTSKPLGAYGLGSAGTFVSDEQKFIDDLIQQYGDRLERLDIYGKYVLRASLSLYLCWLYKLTSQQESIPETLIDEAIDQTDPDCWQGSTELDVHIAGLATLPVDLIEALLEALTDQLRHDQTIA